MKHPKKLTLILLTMFLITQTIGILVINQYSPQTTQQVIDGELVNVTTHNLPYGTEPPSDLTPQSTLISIVFAITIAVLLMLIIMKYNAEIIMRLWFFFVVTLAMGITINAFILGVRNSTLIALAVALPLAIIKIFKRDILVHNLTELIIYPGIAVIFVPLLNIWTIVIIFVLISLWDMYAVWHSGIMQKMAKYQIEKVRVFGGFFVPYLKQKDKAKIMELRKNPKKLAKSKIKVNIAILGGGDVVFPIILAGVVLRSIGLLQAILIPIGASLALAYLFYSGQKGKAYPAMPYISIGCFIALGIGYLL